MPTEDRLQPARGGQGQAPMRGMRERMGVMGSLLGLVAALAVSAWVWSEAWRTVQADWRATPARLELERWMAGGRTPPDPARLDAVATALQAAAQATPDDPGLHERLGDLAIVQARLHWDDAALRQASANRAVQHYLRAIALRPAEPGAWAALAMARWLSGAPREAVYQAWSRSLALGPHEGHVQPVLMEIVLADWDQAPEAATRWAGDLFDQSSEGTRRQINALAKTYGLRFEPNGPSSGGK